MRLEEFIQAINEKADPCDVILQVTDDVNLSNISDTLFSNFIHALSKATQLQSLSLKANFLFRLAYPRFSLLITTISKLPNLTYLDLSINQFGGMRPTFITLFFQELTNSPSLTFLNLTQNLLHSFRISKEKLEAMINFINNAPCLKFLNLSNNNLGFWRDFELSFAKSTNQTIHDSFLDTIHKSGSLNSINLSGNELENWSPNELSKFLKSALVSPNLENLDLSRNRLGGWAFAWKFEHFKILGNYLANSKIKNLNLSYTALERRFSPFSDALLTLMEGIRNCQSLVSLDLSGNSIGTWAKMKMEVFCIALQNQNIRTINIADNQLDKLDETNFLMILKGLKNSGVTHVVMDGTDNQKVRVKHVIKERIHRKSLLAAHCLSLLAFGESNRSYLPENAIFSILSFYNPYPKLNKQVIKEAFGAEKEIKKAASRNVDDLKCR